MLASQRWHMESNFRLVVPHRAMPSLCSPPSAARTGGRAISRPWEVSFREEVYCRFGHSRTWVQKQGPCSKASNWHLGVPGARLLVFACQSVGVVWRTGVSVCSLLLSHRKRHTGCVFTVLRTPMVLSGRGAEEVLHISGRLFCVFGHLAFKT